MKLGLLVRYKEEDLALLKALGCESCQLIVWPDDPLSPSNGSGPDEWKKARERLDAMDIEVSAIGSYDNNLCADPEIADRSLYHLELLFGLADTMGCKIIGTFAGRDPEKSIPDNIPAFKKAFTPLCKKAADRGKKIAIEGCPMFLGWPFRGTNFAYTPESWDLMFDAVPSDALGLEYDASHLICQMIDPVAVIDRYGSKIFHAHAKDAEIEPVALQKYGILDARTTRHRMPGLGHGDWVAIVSRLKHVGYKGNIDIEGRHDPEYYGDREEEGLRIAVAAMRGAIAKANGLI